MRFALRLNLLLLALLTGVVRLCPAQSPLNAVIKIEIKFVGPQTVSEDLTRGNIRTKVGDQYLPAAVDEDIKNLYATGFFYTIRVMEDRTRDGVVLTYRVQGKPKLTETKFSGNKKYKDAKLRKKLTSKVGDPLDEYKLFNDVQTIKKMYQKAGYPNTEVKYVLNIDENAGRGTATLEIKENPKYRIVDVVFAGAKAFPQKKLRKVIKTRRHWMFSWITGSGVLKEDQLEDDKEKLAEFYRDNGYIDFELKDVKYEHPSPNRMIVKFEVFEGSPYKVGAVTFKGTTLLPTNAVQPGYKSPAKPPQGTNRLAWAEGRQLNRTFAMKAGDVFKPKGLEKDVEAVEDSYGSRGYIDATENSGNLRVDKIPNTEKNTMDLQFNVNEGQKSYIEKVEIRGNTKTKDKVIRRELAVSPGETFDMVKVKISKARLEGLQYFEKVDTKPEATDVPNRKNLIVGVEEKNTGNFTLGAGFSSIDSLVGFVDISQGNFDLFNAPTFTGGGQKARLHLALGTQRSDVVLSFIEPWFMGYKLALGTDFFYHKLDFLSANQLFNESELGAQVSLTRALWRDFLIGSVSYSIRNVGIIDVSPLAPLDIQSQAGYSVLSTVGASLAYDTRNSVLLPNKGQRTELLGSLTGGPFGGDQNFYKLDLRTSWYFRGFAKGHVLEVMGRVGVSQALSGMPDVPFYERYYLGGMYSLRGFKFREVGPRQPTLTAYPEWEPIGGDTSWFGSLEYSIPIIERLRFAVFYDMGMVYPKAFSFSPDPSRGPGYDTGMFNSDYGIGIRLNLPIGPLRLDYGIPLQHDKFNGGSGKFQFGVGYTRDF